MAKGVPYSSEFREEILNRIKAGEKVADLAREYSLQPRLIYQWMARSTEVKSDKNYVLEINKLNREVEELYRLIGKLTADMSKKKDRINS